jgi:hypothetical protein
MTKKTQKPSKPAKLPKQSGRAKPANQATPAKKSKPAQPAKPPAKAYIVFGADEYAKPRAARFSTDDALLLEKAVEAMHLRLVEAKNEELAEIATRLPAGRLHASGGGLVPYIKGELYSELLSATLADDWPRHNPGPAAQELPGSWDEVAPGHVVIARETFECGWWEAVVIERNGDLVTLRYRDYPKYPALIRHRSAVALIGAPAP